jgi:hypothetical protein
MGLSYNPKYRHSFRVFQSYFLPEKADKLVQQYIGQNQRFITKDEIYGKVGLIVGKVIYEELTVSEQLKAKIIGFGSGLSYILKKLGKKPSTLNRHSKRNSSNI